MASDESMAASSITAKQQGQGLWPTTIPSEGESDDGMLLESSEHCPPPVKPHSACRSALPQLKRDDDKRESGTASCIKNGRSVSAEAA